MSFQPPTGTRDLYPEDALRRRYITEAWRNASIRHGFEEIDGPTFEHLDLYTVKSGEGIVSELFSFERFGGEKKFALRPEFTPTLARMYAAKAGSLPKPTKWFMAGPFFRAERPQRGRLREFLQWNVDYLGLDIDWTKKSDALDSVSEEGIAEAKARADAEVIACCVDMFAALGLKGADITVRISDRSILQDALVSRGVAPQNITPALALLDKQGKLPPAEFAAQASAIGLDVNALAASVGEVQSRANACLAELERTGCDAAPSDAAAPMLSLVRALSSAGVAHWCEFDFSIVRGLAYYTGMVFEVIVDGERAVAGGGRYDNLIELFGGPPTPAVGFGMGDVVLSLVLKDKGLLPEGKTLLEKLSEPAPSLRPDVFVIASPNEGCEAQVPAVLARARRAGLHARRSYKSTRNIGKLLKDAASQFARFALIIETPDTCTLKNLDTQEQQGPMQIAAAIDTTRGIRR